MGDLRGLEVGEGGVQEVADEFGEEGFVGCAGRGLLGGVEGFGDAARFEEPEHSREEEGLWFETWPTLAPDVEG